MGYSPGPAPRTRDRNLNIVISAIWGELRALKAVLDTGKVGGFTLGGDFIRDAANSFGLASTITGGDDVRFWAGATFANRATAPFTVTEAGVVNTTSGTIGGFTLGATTLTAGAGATAVGLASSGSFLIYAGNATPASAPFRVGMNGDVRTDKLEVAGTSTFSTLTASLPVFTNASSQLTSSAISGTGSVAMTNSPTFVTPALGTPASGILSNCISFPAGVLTGPALAAAVTASSLTSVGTLTSLAITAGGLITYNSASLGVWTAVTFDAANFTASGSMTWTVAAGDQGTYAYNIVGNMMTVGFAILTSTVGGTLSTTLKIKIPASKTASGLTMNPCVIIDNGTTVTGHCYVQGGGTVINIERTDGANFLASTDLTAVYGVLALAF